MSSDDFKAFHQLLSNLLSPDNTLRGEAEKQLNLIKSNSGPFVLYLSKIILESQEKGIKTLSSVLLRKTLEVKSSEDISPVWKSIDQPTRDQIKFNMIQSMIQEQNKNMKIKYADTVATIAESVFEGNEKWDDFFNFIYQGISLLPDGENNIGNIETVLFLMSQIFGYIHDELSSKLDSFIVTFENFFKTNSFDLKTRTSQVIGEILCVVQKKESKKFKPFIPFILEHTYKCLIDSHQEANLKLCLMAISDLVTSEPNILRKSFPDLFILLGKVIENKSLEESNLRDLSFEILVAMVENSPKLLKDDPEKTTILIQSLFKYALEMDSEVTEEWTTPKTLSFIEEDVVPEAQLQLALGMVERLCDVLDSKKILELLVSIVHDLLGNPSNEWRYKYTGFMIICSIIDEVDDITEVKNILPVVFQNLKNEHPKIRFACNQVIEVAIDQFSPHFHEQFHVELIPNLLLGIQDPILRCQLQVSETLNAFVDSSPEEILETHTKSILDVLFNLLLNESTYVSLKENILNILSSLTSNSKENTFKLYASSCLDILLKVFSNSYKIGKDKTLYGSLIELITTVGPNCENEYLSIIPDVINAMITLQNAIPYSTDPLFEYLNSGWEKLIPYIKKNYINYSNIIIESALKLVSNVPTMKVNSAPEKTFNIQDLLKDDTQDPKIVKQKVTVHTSETQDYAASIALLCTIIEQFGEVFGPYFDHTEKTIIPLLTFEVNDDIRVEAASVLPFLIDIVKKQGNVQVLHEKAKNYLSSLILALEKESFNGAISNQLDSIGSIIEKVGLFLEVQGIRALFIKLLEIFDKVEKSRLELIKRKDETEEEFEKDRKEGNNKINSDDEEDDDEDEILEDMKKDVEEVEDVLVSIADIMGSMFKTHKELTLDVVQSLVNELLPKYFSTTASSFENKMGLYIIDDIIEFLGQNLVGHLWNDLAKILITYADDKEPALRQAAVYGIGEFSVNTTKDFSLYVSQLLEAIDKALRHSSDGQNKHQWEAARDNAVGAIGKIIKYQSSSVGDIRSLIKAWVDHLPITHDDVEGQKIHKIFVELLQNNADIVIGAEKENLPKVIRIIGKIYDTKFVEDQTNEDLKKIIANIKSNPQLNGFIDSAIQDAHKEIKQKLTELFK